jgi:hypothetical protein
MCKNKLLYYYYKFWPEKKVIRMVPMHIMLHILLLIHNVFRFINTVDQLLKFYVAVMIFLFSSTNENYGIFL